MKFKIGDKIYDTGTLNDLPLKYILQLEKETADFGHPMNMTSLQQMSDEIAALKTDKEKQAHPASIWLTAVGVWAAKKLAGENVTFDEAVDFPLSSMSFIASPEDHRKPDPRKARPRKGSGPAVKRQPAANTTT